MELSQRTLAVITMVIAALAVTATVAGASPGPGGWGAAEQIPGTAARNSGGQAVVAAVSCRPVGNCSAGGTYTNSAGNRQPFVATQTSGRWGTAQRVPGIAALIHGGSATIISLSCGSVGNCAAGGGYFDAATRTGRAFVTTESNGAWGTAQPVAGTLDQGGGGLVESLSCAAAGDCSAGGSYLDRHGLQQAFVVDETNGTWGTAEEVPGTAALDHGSAEVMSLSCASAGDCSAGGYYTDRHGLQQAFVVNETNGTWGSAEPVPGAAALNQGGIAEIGSIVCGLIGGCSSLSCASAGDCSAGGYYTDSSGLQQAFVVSETNGIWGTAEEVPGTAALNQGNAQLVSVSCASAGDCSAGGFYGIPGGFQAFVAGETNGVWGRAEEVPGIAALNQGGVAEVDAVSCAAAGDCSAGGYYEINGDLQPLFVVSETNGIWRTAQSVPGIKALDKGFATITSLSCDPVAHCSAGGLYTGRHGREQTFVASQT